MFVFSPLASLKKIRAAYISGRLPLLHWCIKTCPTNSLPFRGSLQLKKIKKSNQNLIDLHSSRLLPVPFVPQKKLGGIHQWEASPSPLVYQNLSHQRPPLQGRLAFEKITLQKSNQKFIDLHVCFQPAGFFKKESV